MNRRFRLAPVHHSDRSPLFFTNIFYSTAFFQLLALSALRRAEAAEASWPEFGDWIELEDMGAKRFIIPHERMKNKPGAAPRPHLVSIVPAIASLLRELPRHVGGNFLFSATGANAISGFGRAKAELDALMRADLEAKGRRGKPYSGRTDSSA